MDNILEFQGITKDFSGTVVLKDVSFTIKKGDCHCIIGENGAGKSTLIKILMGVYKRTSGEIFYEGEEFEVHSTKDAFEKGIAAVFQELNMVDSLTVEENITLGRENINHGLLSKSNDENSLRVFDTLKKIEPDLNLSDIVGRLSFAQKQMIEIAKALGSAANVIILDEPTAALSADEVTKLFTLIRELKRAGISIIYISHRLDELFEIGDTITVLKDGQHVATKSRAEIKDRSELIHMMLGRMVVEDYIQSDIDYDVKVMEIKNLSTKLLHDISFDLYKGEILGVYGLIGSGKSETARAIFGADHSVGQMKVFGRVFKRKNTKDSIDNGIVLIPEERRQQGLCTELAIQENIPMMNYKPTLKMKLYSAKAARKLADAFIERLGIVARSSQQMVLHLSGGNQQKVVLSKSLNSNPKILLLDEPTRGVDVGAKQEIYSIIRDLSKTGNSIIVFSSELPEIINLCDRIVLLYEGHLKKILTNDDHLDSAHIMHIVTGGELGNVG